jgi:hypothetical protein
VYDFPAHARDRIPPDGLESTASGHHSANGLLMAVRRLFWSRRRYIAKVDLLSWRFRSNEVRLWLSVMAYNLGNLWRRLVLPKRIDNWSLTSLQQRLVKTGGRLIKHARYYWLLLAESHLTRRLFRAMVRRIAALPVATG